MRTYIRLLGSGALTLVGLGATLLVQGGWEAAAAAFAIFSGLVFAVSFISLRVAAERPRSGHPGWAVAGSERRGVSASAEAERARASVRDVRPGRVSRSPRRHPPAAVGVRSA
jgi:hypothetical protein